MAALKRVGMRGHHPDNTLHEYELVYPYVRDQNNIEQKSDSSPCMNVSIVIPTYNEADSIAGLVEHLKNHAPKAEVIVVDGGSSDGTLQSARAAGACGITSGQKGRACQMNEGAARARGDILYFVHADSFPPPHFISHIKKAVDARYPAGCFRFTFDSGHPLLKINAFMTRFDGLMCRGGDQTLFITRRLFDKLGGFRNDYVIMEDFEFIERIRESNNFKIVPEKVTVSARKYEQNNYLKVQFANFVVFMMYRLGCSQDRMVQTYKRLIYHPKF